MGDSVEATLRIDEKGFKKWYSNFWGGSPQKN